VPTSSVQVLWTARYDYQPQWQLAEHQHEYFQMIYFVSGTGKVELGGEQKQIQPGLLLLVKPRTMHGLSADSLVKTLDVKFSVKDRWLRKLLVRTDDMLFQTEPGFADKFEQIRDEGERKGPFYRELCSTYLIELLFLFLRGTNASLNSATQPHHERELPSDAIVQQATQYIKENHARECSLIEISRAVGKSDRHVRQHFKDSLGISPRRYLLQFRIHKAQQLIEYSDYAFKEIAEKVGFKTIHHFARAFHEISGETPGGWRKRYQNGICKDVNIDPTFVNTNWIVRAESDRQQPGRL
jgi:AraC-like DNA-binding protein